MSHAQSLLIKASLGLGKTTAVLRAIAKLRGNVSVAFLVPSLAKAEEVLRDYKKFRDKKSLPAYIFRGRGSYDPAFLNAKLMCHRYSTSTIVAESRASIRQILCTKCPLQNECGYQRQLNIISKTKNKLIIAVHEYLFLPDVFGSPDIIIVDEFVTLKAADAHEFSLDAIVSCFSWELLKKSLLAPDALQTLIKIQEVFKNKDAQYLEELRKADLKFHDIRQAREFLEQSSQFIFYGIDGSMSNSEIEERLKPYKQFKTSAIIAMLRQIEIEWNTGRRDFNSIVVSDDSKDREDKELAGRCLLVYSLKPAILAKNKPLLLLDGTADFLLNQKLFGEDLQYVDIKVERDAQVTQVINKGFSNQSVIGKRIDNKPIRHQEAHKLQSEIANFTHNLLHQSVLVVSNKGVEEVLGPLFKPHVNTAHFGAVRGLNAYEECEAEVIIGREQPPWRSIERIARAYCASDLEPFFSIVDIPYDPNSYAFCATRGLRMRNGTVKPISVRIHPHPIAQAIMEQKREAEIVQAADRVRPLSNRRYIYLLNSIVADITVDETVSWKDLKNGGNRFEQAAKRSPVVPVSPAEMARLFPDLWPTPEAAEHDIQRTSKIQIELLFGKWRFNVVQYKLLKRKGSLAAD